MKTNRSARRLMRIRGIALALAIVALVGIEFRLGETFVARSGLTAAHPAASVPAPNVSLGDLLAAAR